MKKYFLIEFATQGIVSSAEYYAETEQEAIEFFRQDFGGVAVIEYCKVVVDEEDYDDSTTTFLISFILDGDAGSALASAGWGTDKDYGYADEVM